MQQFFIDYGLWLLIALLIVIVLVFLLGGRKKAGSENSPAERPAAIEARKITPGTPEPVVPAGTPEPVAPMAPPELAEAPVAAPVPASPAVTSIPQGHDDLLKLKGVGPKLNLLLIELGVTRYAQIASWNDADIAAIDAKLGNFKGRPVRDQWIDQAKYLAAGDVTGFEAKYGKI